MNRALRGHPLSVFVIALLSLLIFSLNGYCQVGTRTELKIPDILGYVTLKCDFHIHTVFSDGNVWPDVRAKEAWLEGLDAFAITDHIEYQPHKEVQVDRNRSYEIALPTAKDMDLIIIKGSEITRDMPPGHFNAIFLKDSEPLNRSDSKEAIKAAYDQDAFLFWNHPPDNWTPVHTELLEKGMLNGIEVINGNTYYPHAHKWCIEKNLTMIGNSDTHSLVGFEYDLQAGHRPMTLVFAKEKSESAIKEALLAHRTAIYSKSMLIGDEKFLKPIFDASIEIKNPGTAIKGKGSANLQIYNRSDIPFELVANGKINEASGPEKITLYSNRTVLVRVTGNADKLVGKEEIGIPYIVKNLLIAPEKSLPVELKVAIEGTQVPK